MNLIYEKYAESKMEGISKKDWEDFGYEALVKLFLFMGVQTDKDLNSFARTFKYHEYPSGKILLSKEEVSQKVYFIISGTMMMYTVNDGIENVQGLINDGNLVASMQFLSNDLSDINIRTESKCRVLVLDFEDLLRMMTTGWAMEIMKVNEVVLTRTNYITTQLANIRQLEAAERINQILQLNPSMFQDFSAKHIAGLIGLSPSTLSKLRATLK